MCTSSRQTLRRTPSSSSWNSAWIEKMLLPRRCSLAGCLKTRTASKFYHPCKLRRIIRTSMKVGEPIQDCFAIRVRDNCLKEGIMTIIAYSLKSHQMVCVETLLQRCPMGLQIKVWSTNRNSKERWLWTQALSSYATIKPKRETRALLELHAVTIWSRAKANPVFSQQITKRTDILKPCLYVHQSSHICWTQVEQTTNHCCRSGHLIQMLNHSASWKNYQATKTCTVISIASTLSSSRLS